MARDTSSVNAAASDLTDVSAEADATSAVSEACSFSADTQVATPSGAQRIGSLQAGNTVEAYNPTTGKAEPETVQHVWLNHDHDLVDVRVQTAAAAGAAAASGTSSQTAQTASSASRLAGVVKAAAALASLALTLASGHAVAATTDTLTSSSAAATRATAQAETIHTTANHPWLTADRGWVVAGDLAPGVPVVTLNPTLRTTPC